ncbi:glutamine--fructose-6-phosphate transaminase (isomerizing) [Candidatus Purcelliella pentastirinorum]|uniref:glutamine--fructose-6-phosphate transaminase (isomerizing) n=1 Tax=Candidatus Purcelliella pentastirinorum TaxID=472834 RepID=UPI00237B32A7|nr:glutamine--fructose-6-phosphate transaminase (isomerizing) [Candidatus Purcelliella pentastirinorum]WDR80437.1 glutamine--fructose-6-phosphate transaminase (isomerizing) [Candidatus Purcelliella pentastirinorum]
MCGIIGAVAQRDITELLLNGLKRLEYRGYDSSGIATINSNKRIQRIRKTGNVKKLIKKIKKNPINGKIGIAHTRWATHGKPTKKNTHPHISENIIIVHNGIIENYSNLRKKLKTIGYHFTSDTDTEVIAHMLHHEQKKGGKLKEITRRVINKLKGSYSIVIMDQKNPSILIATKFKSSLIIGKGINENFIASDQQALLSVTNNFIFLEEGDIAEVSCINITINNINNKIIKRKTIKSTTKYEKLNNNLYKNYMQKEIYQQPLVTKNTIKKYLKKNEIKLNNLKNNYHLLKKIKNIQIIACGTSYHAGLIARYWFEEIAKISCNVDIASEFRYRKPIIQKNTLIIAISQSGETADTLEALKILKKSKYLSSIAICNTEKSSLVKNTDFSLITEAGTEISVASTKTFTTQLTILLILITKISLLKNNKNKKIIKIIKKIPKKIKEILFYEKKIKKIAKKFLNINNTLFIGKGKQYPTIMEGALKMKEISYIHAEAYPAGELKHGPLAIIDKNIPIIITVEKNNMLKKIKISIEEINARGGIIYILADQTIKFKTQKNITIIPLPHVNNIISPIIYTIPLQLLAYHVAIIKGTNIDQPRNLAKSVTVE